MEELTQEELKRMLIFASEKIEKEKEEINKINVFPVPDQDTGTNLSKTLQGIREAIKGKDFKNLEEISQQALDGALMAAQGNAGVIFTGFLAGFLPTLNKNPVKLPQLALAFEEGKKRAWKSMLNPKEGTILDVIDATAKTFQEESEREKDIVKVLEKAIENAKEALLLTREKMEILRKANVVDAGGLGFLMILESFLEALTPERKEEKEKEVSSGQIKRFIQILTNRYEVVALILNPQMEEEEIKERLKTMGNCLDIVRVGKKMKIHIHTDFPEETREILKEIGQIEDLRVEDMAKEVIREPSVRTVSLGLITENTTFLLPKIIERYQIELLETFLGKEKKEDYLDKYEKTIKKQLTQFEKVLFLISSAKISKTLSLLKGLQENLAEKDQKRISIFNTQQVLSGQALFVLRAIELIREQREMEEVVEELQKLLKRTHLYIFLKKPKTRQILGKLNQLQIDWIKKKRKVGIYPLMKVEGGKLKSAGLVVADSEAEAIFKKLKNISQKKKARAVIHHCQNLEEAKKLEKLLKSAGVEVSFLAEIRVDENLIGGGSLMCALQEI